MKLISWNVNGLRACVQKGFLDFFRDADADFFCLQETKLQEGQIALDLPGYEQYWYYAEKKGYSGTAIFTKHTPLSVKNGIGVPDLDTEGRVITLEYEEFFLVTCYTPNAQRGLARLDYRLTWEKAFADYLCALDQKKPVILCGDLNVAHQEIDLKNPSANRGNAGFSDEERAAFGALLDRGFTDSFRHLHPDVTGAYTWWSYMFNARQNNAGWRIDYFVVSDRIKDRIFSTPIHADILGSDHCPVELGLDLPCNGSIWQDTPVGEPELIPVEKSAPAFSLPKAGIIAMAVVTLLIGCVSGLLLQPVLFPREDLYLYEFYKKTVLPSLNSTTAITGNFWNLYYIDADGMLVSTVTGNKLPLSIGGLHSQPAITPTETTPNTETPIDPVPPEDLIVYVPTVEKLTVTVSKHKLKAVRGLMYYSDGNAVYRTCMTYTSPDDPSENILWICQAQYAQSNENFWVRIEVPAGKMTADTKIKCTPLVGAQSLTILSLYNDMQEPSGFLCCGQWSQTFLMHIRVYNEKLGYEEDTIVQVTPIPSDNTYTSMLLNYAATLPEICTLASTTPYSVTSKTTKMLIDQYPLLETLFQRENFTQCITPYIESESLENHLNYYVLFKMEQFYRAELAPSMNINPVPDIDFISPEDE